MSQKSCLSVSCVLILFLLNIQQGFSVTNLLSNPVYQSQSSNAFDTMQDGDWHEIPEPSVNIFDAVRNNNTPSGQDVIKSIPAVNTILNPTGFQFFGGNDAASLFSVPQIKPQSQEQRPLQSQAISTGITDEELEKFINSIGGFDTGNFEDIPTGSQQVNTQQYPVWNMQTTQSGLYPPQQVLMPPPSPPPLAAAAPRKTISQSTSYPTSVPYQSRRNIFYPKYTTNLNTPVQQNTRWRRTPLFTPQSLNMVQYNRQSSTQYPLNSQIQRIPPTSNLYFRQSQLPIARQYIQFSKPQYFNAPRWRTTLQQPYGQVVMPQNNIRDTRFLVSVNPYDRTRRLFW
ncbi:unnamed protein product [Trichobilharzia szidati]|nr:unnamed protein product [Trichobilharzia szidati]